MNKFRKLLKIVVGLLLLFAVAIGLTSISHPIILKWVTGSARHVGKPIQATVYTNGQVNNDIKFSILTNIGEVVKKQTTIY